MTLRKTAFLLVSVTSLTQCATIINGSTDSIKLNTNPPSNASCKLTNSREIVNATAPSPVAIKKSKSALDVVCTDNQTGVTGQKRVESEIDPWDYANILNGGVGMVVDWVTGAAYDYPPEALVPMGGSAAVPSAYYQQNPAYQPTTTVTTVTAPAAPAQPASAGSTYAPGTGYAPAGTSTTGTYTTTTPGYAPLSPLPPSSTAPAQPSYYGTTQPVSPYYAPAR